MLRYDEHLLKRISEIKNSIRKKYNQFKKGLIDTDELLERQFKPLLSELKKPSSELKVKLEPEIKPDPNSIPIKNDAFVPTAASSPNKTIVQNLPDAEIFGDVSSNDGDISAKLSTTEGLEEASQYINEHFTNPLTRKYMLKLMKDVGGSKRTIDHTFGPRFEGNTLMVGNKNLEFDDDGSIRIENTIYKPTEGLYELLFKRIPDEEVYDENDRLAYRDILLKTNGHKKGYKNSSHINRDNSLKYKNVISELFPKRLYGGEGLITKNLSQRDLSYWDNPNELCNRLKILVASTEIGNTSHGNEIINIVSELREAGFISGRGNKRFYNLLNNVNR